MKTIFPHKKQTGVTLLESLVALAVLALGVLGLVGVQARMLVETRTTNARATAIRLISQLGQTVYINPTADIVTNYQKTDWNAPATNAPNTGCSNMANGTRSSASIAFATQAACDRWNWLRAVNTTLPDGRAQITPVAVGADNRQFRVVIAWRLNEKNDAALSDTMKVTTGTGATDACLANYICHMQYIELPPPL